MQRIISPALMFLLVALLLFVRPAHAGEAQATPIDATTRQAFMQAPILLLCRIDEVREGPTAQSYPPIYNTHLTLSVQKVYRGQVDSQKPLQAIHSVRTEHRPVFNKGDMVIIAAQIERRAGEVLATQITHVAPADEAHMNLASLAGIVPVGWKVDAEQKLTCPWATIPGYELPQVKIDLPACHKTGRQAWLAGPIQFDVQPIIDPQKQKKWTNPDGDGQFKITLTNPTDQPLTVKALFKRGEQILWNQSLLILCDGVAYTLPGTGKLQSASHVTLAPGESVSTTLNILSLQGPPWPQGGSRVDFTFALGEHAIVHSFYYHSGHHDPLRAAAQAP